MMDQTIEGVLAFWFPDDGFHHSADGYRDWMFERMQGGMDDAICAHYTELTASAAQGELDHWAETARGRLALLLVLDQFPRSLWQDTPAAFAQDIKACRIALEGYANGHFHECAPWEKIFFLLPVSHCEGPDHLARFERIEEMTESIVVGLPDHLAYAKDRVRSQTKRVRGIIERFGRHPHRNPILGRISTPEEEAYIADGDFPHVQARPPA